MAITNIINLSELEFGNRIDGEIYNPRLKVSKTQLLKTGFAIKKLKETCIIKSGTTPKDRNDSIKEGPILFKTTDIRNSVLNPSASYYHISDKIYNRMSATKLVENDVLLNIVGATLDVIGRSAFTANYFEKANITQAMVFLRIKKDLKPGYLFSYLNTKYAQDQIKRFARPTGQFNLNLNEVGRIEIPIISTDEQIIIHNLILKSGDHMKLSSDLMKQANDLLEQELGLNNISFEKTRNFTATFGEIASTRRMNAEYFSPVIKDILNLPFLIDAVPLSSLFKIIRGTSPSSYIENGVPVIKTKNIRLPEIDRERISDCVKSAKDFTPIQENDLLLASMGVGSLGRMSFIHLLEKEYIVDGTIRILRKKNDAPANYEIPTLLFLSSKAGQELIYRGIVGSTGIISLPDDFLSKIPIPKFSDELALKVSEMVKKSMIARKQSKDLLVQAKNRVEQLIEEAATKN